MTADEKIPEGFSLKRWSRVKRESTRAAVQPPPTDPPSSIAPPVPVVAANAPQVAAAASPAPELPPIESLTMDSDFTAFLQPKVDEVLKRKALKKLFGDPRFNVMDGLDVYIDDYSKPDPLAPEVARQLVQARAILDARPTRINAQGILEDVPAAERESPGGPVAKDAPGVEAAIAGSTAPNAGALAPEAEATPSALVTDGAAPAAPPEGEPKSEADSR